MFANNNNKWKMPDYKFKVIVTGLDGVGHTNLIRVATGRRFVDSYMPTRNSEFIYHEIEIDSKFISVQIWESLKKICPDRITLKNSPDSDRDKLFSYDSTMPYEFSGVDAIFFLFDVNDPVSFNLIEDYIIKVNNFEIPSTCLKILIGTKIDKRSALCMSPKFDDYIRMRYRKVPEIDGINISPEFASNFADYMRMEYREVSAKMDTNISTLLMDVAGTLMSNKMAEAYQTAKSIASPSQYTIIQQQKKEGLRTEEVNIKTENKAKPRYS